MKLTRSAPTLLRRQPSAALAIKLRPSRLQLDMASTAPVRGISASTGPLCVTPRILSLSYPKYDMRHVFMEVGTNNIKKPYSGEGTTRFETVRGARAAASACALAAFVLYRYFAENRSNFANSTHMRTLASRERNRSVGYPTVFDSNHLLDQVQT